jgi:SAM-dependent methyltransferase
MDLRREDPVTGSIRCPSCGSGDHRVFYEVASVPVHSCIMFATESAARDFPRRRIELALCRACGFVWNAAFDPSVQDYSPRYEDQQCYSATFNAFARGLAESVISKYGLRGKDIVEIGCGKGDFLAMMCEMGGNRGVGIDPSCEKERIEGPARDRITVIQDYYSEKYSHHTGDLVMCRHTLEHIHDTREFVRTVRKGIGDRRDTVVFFEIPEITIVLENLVFWDIYYEHCSYFSPGSLGRLFRSCGFEVLDLYTGFDDQYLMIEARPADAPSPSPHPREESVLEMTGRVERFRAGVGEQKARWLRLVREKHAAGDRPVIWGSGSKCVAFLSTLGIDDEIGCVVDINPRRHGKYITGAVKRIEPPEYLKEYQPRTIIAMNPIYKNEIAAMAERMGLSAEVIAV